MAPLPSDLPYWVLQSRLDHSKPPRVVVSGIGLETGFAPAWTIGAEPGSGTEQNWQAIRAGRIAVRSLGPLMAEGGPPFLGVPRCGATLPDSDRLINPLLLGTVDEAVRDAGLGRLSFDPDRTSALIGLSKGAVRSLSRAIEGLDQEGDQSDRVGRDFFESWPSFGATTVASRYGLRGPSSSPVAACATGLVSVLMGWSMIRRGVCDIAFCGAVDASLEPILLGAFRKMKALAKGDGPPEEAVKPWDRRRSGFVIGEGGAVLILERDDHARARGIVPYAEVAGGALGSDAFHETNLNPNPTRLAAILVEALERSGVGPDEVDHINVHGTATRSNDPLECRAIRKALGTHADRVSCSANKGQIGHLLGGAGAAELAITCLAIRDQFVPPTVNLTEPDPECDLDGTPGFGRAREIRAAIKLSLGFGGHLSALVLRRPEGPRRTGPDSSTSREGSTR